MAKIKYQERTEEDTGSTKYRFMFSGYKWALGLISPAGDKDILDCACGRGYGSHYLSGFARHVTGVDVSQEAILHCRKNYSNANLEYLAADATALPFADDTFDAVISQDTIEHVPDDRAFLSEVKRVLKPGGTLVVFTPHSKEHNERPANNFHIREYSKETFSALLAPYFPEVRYYGKKLSRELAELEATLDAVRGKDFLGLRRIVPRPLRHLIGNVIAFLRGRRLITSITEDDVDFVENPEESLTLIAVCRKPLRGPAENGKS